MKTSRRFLVASVPFLLAGAPLHAVPEFDCVTIVEVDQPPAECLDPENAAWCPCLKTEFTTLQGGEPAAVQQAHVYIVGQSTPGIFTMSVSGGTLDLTQITVGDVFGQNLIDIPIQGNFFLLDFAFKVTDEEVNKVHFEVRLVLTNPFSVDVLRYDPLGAAHSEGLTYEGMLESFGPGRGFEFSYHLVENPPGGERGISFGDLSDPGFNVPALFSLFASDPPVPEIPPLFTLPPQGGLISVETMITHITDPLLEKSFIEEFRVVPGVVAERFRRGDSNQDGLWDISDAIGTLGALFLGEEQPRCPDAADANDDSVVDISDAVTSLGGLFLGEPPPPAPGPRDCGPDLTGDELGKCEYRC